MEEAQRKVWAQIAKKDVPKVSLIFPLTSLSLTFGSSSGFRRRGAYVSIWHLTDLQDRRRRPYGSAAGAQEDCHCRREGAATSALPNGDDQEPEEHPAQVEEDDERGPSHTPSLLHIPLLLLPFLSLHVEGQTKLIPLSRSFSHFAFGHVWYACADARLLETKRKRRAGEPEEGRAGRARQGEKGRRRTRVETTVEEAQLPHHPDRALLAFRWKQDQEFVHLHLRFTFLSIWSGQVRG
jgi:hypothetical protein